MVTKQFVRIQLVEPLEGFRVRLGFTDDTQRVVDLEPYLHGSIFDPMREHPQVFRAVRVDRRAGTIAWPNGADIDPDVLYHDLKPAWMEEPEREIAG
jgi:hypothetical protein